MVRLYLTTPEQVSRYKAMGYTIQIGSRKGQYVETSERTQDTTRIHIKNRLTDIKVGESELFFDLDEVEHVLGQDVKFMVEDFTKFVNTPTTISVSRDVRAGTVITIGSDVNNAFVVAFDDDYRITAFDDGRGILSFGFMVDSTGELDTNYTDIGKYKDADKFFDKILDYMNMSDEQLLEATRENGIGAENVPYKLPMAYEFWKEYIKEDKYTVSVLNTAVNRVTDGLIEHMTDSTKMPLERHDKFREAVMSYADDIRLTGDMLSTSSTKETIKQCLVARTASKIIGRDMTIYLDSPESNTRFKENKTVLGYCRGSNIYLNNYTPDDMMGLLGGTTLWHEFSHWFDVSVNEAMIFDPDSDMRPQNAIQTLNMIVYDSCIAGYIPRSYAMKNEKEAMATYWEYIYNGEEIYSGLQKKEEGFFKMLNEGFQTSTGEFIQIKTKKPTELSIIDDIFNEYSEVIDYMIKYKKNYGKFQDFFE